MDCLLPTAILDWLEEWRLLFYGYCKKFWLSVCKFEEDYLFSEDLLRNVADLLWSENCLFILIFKANDLSIYMLSFLL